MKLLLDESCPRQLKSSFSADYAVWTVQECGWAGKKNGMLLRLAAEARFIALITADKHIGHQQNLVSLPVAVIIMDTVRTRIGDLLPLIPQVESLIQAGVEAEIYRVSA